MSVPPLPQVGWGVSVAASLSSQVPKGDLFDFSQGSHEEVACPVGEKGRPQGTVPKVPAAGGLEPSLGLEDFEDFGYPGGHQGRPPEVEYEEDLGPGGLAEFFGLGYLFSLCHRFGRASVS